LNRQQHPAKEKNKKKIIRSGRADELQMGIVEEDQEKGGKDL